MVIIRFLKTIETRAERETIKKKSYLKIRKKKIISAADPNSPEMEETSNYVPHHADSTASNIFLV